MSRQGHVTYRGQVAIDVLDQAGAEGGEHLRGVGAGQADERTRGPTGVSRCVYDMAGYIKRGRTERRLK